MASQSNEIKLSNDNQFQYLSKMKKKLEMSSQQKVQQFLKSKQTDLKQQIEKGSIQIHQEDSSMKNSRSISDQNNNKQKQKLKKRFYLASNPQTIQENYNKFLLLKNQYSHQKTSTVVKQVQQKIKGWMKRQKTASIRRQHHIQKQIQQDKKSQQLQQEVKRKSLEIKKQQYKKYIEEKKNQRQNQKKKNQKQMKKQSISKKMLKQQKVPLYMQRQIQFDQKTREKQYLEQFIQKQKRHFLLGYNSDAIKQHQKKYLEEVKQRQQINQRYQPTSQKNNTDILSNISRTRSEFITTKKDILLIQQQQQMKRIRIKEYVERLKSMSPDKSTLQRIKRVKQEILSSEKIHQENKKQNLIHNRKAHSTKNLLSMNTEINRRKLGNQYLRSQDKYRKIITQKTEENIQDVTQNENEDITKEKPVLNSLNLIKVADLLASSSQTMAYNEFNMENEEKHQQKQKQKQKSSRILSHKKLPIKRQRMSTLPSIEKRPSYKNYLSQLKLKPQRPLTELEKVKKLLKQPTQVLRQFNRRSDELQKKMITKIKEFKKKQKTQKYEKNLITQHQIDQLYHKNLEVKLACLDLS